MLVRPSCVRPGQHDRVKPPNASCLRQPTRGVISTHTGRLERLLSPAPKRQQIKAKSSVDGPDASQITFWDPQLSLTARIGRLVIESHIAKRQSLSGSLRTDMASTPPAAISNRNRMQALHGESFMFDPAPRYSRTKVLAFCDLPNRSGPAFCYSVESRSTLSAPSIP